eukprot:12129368-Alexandrium_andersonii.AAC.1
MLAWRRFPSLVEACLGGAVSMGRVQKPRAGRTCRTLWRRGSRPSYHRRLIWQRGLGPQSWFTG